MNIFTILLLITAIFSNIILFFEQSRCEVGSPKTSILYVGPNSTFTKIQPAVDAANSGDTIIVANGTYYESVNIDTKNIQLIGNSSRDCKIIHHYVGSYNQNNDNKLGDFSSGFIVTASGVNIECFNISVSGNNSFGILVMTNSTSNSNIINNRITTTGWYGHGIYLFNSAKNNLLGNLIITSNVWHGFGIYISNSSNNEITNNEIRSINGFTNNNNILVDKSSNENNVIGNILESNNNKNYGIKIMESCNNNLIYYNNFISTHGGINHAYDNGTNNHWNDTLGEGNFWSNYNDINPLANNNDHVWDLPYELDGKVGAKDYYPLVNIVMFGILRIHDLSQEKSTTGDEFLFECKIPGDINVKSIFLEYWYGDNRIGAVNKSLNFKDKTNTWNYIFKVANNSLEPLNYILSIEDFTYNWFSTEPKIIEIIDNDPPTADAGNDVKTFINEKLVFNSSNCKDNIGVINYSWSFEYNGSQLNLFGKSPKFVFDINGSYLINLTIYDASGLNDSDFFWVNVSRLFIDLTTYNGNTGDNFRFRCQVLIDINIYTILVEYWFGKNSINSTTAFMKYKNTTNVWEYEITLPKNYQGPLNFNFTAFDPDFNWLFIGPKTAIILDDDSPSADAGSDIDTTVGDKVFFNAIMSNDNIGIVNYTWYFLYGEKDVYLYGSNPSFIFNHTGSYYSNLTVRDAAGLISWDTIWVNVYEHQPDTIRPYVLSSMVENYSADSIIVTILTIIFSERMNVKSIMSAIIIYPTVDYYLQWSKSDTVVKVIITTNLSHQISCEINIGVNTTDTAGNALLNPYEVKITIGNTSGFQLNNGEKEGEKEKNISRLIIITVIGVIIFFFVFLVFILKNRRKISKNTKKNFLRRIINWLLSAEEDTELIEKLVVKSRLSAEEAINKAQNQNKDSKEINEAKYNLIKGDIYRDSGFDGNHEDFKKAINEYNTARLKVKL